MKYPAYNHELTLRGNLIELLGVNNTFSESQLFDRAAKQILKRDEAMQRIARACGKIFTVDIGYADLPELVEELLARPDTTQPQLSEIRYVLHGDIQPCSVLYSDDTTTLLRLDEGDMMCETDTIEWSDSVSHRCQELLKSAAARLNTPVTLAPVKLFAQLVRDERILLNDNGDDDLGADERIGRPAVVVPAPPPFGHEKPDHNNPYVHTNNMFTEEAMRKSGWTSESLVSCGHGHYAPVQHPADFYAGHVNPCEDCGHVFDKDAMTCPMCNTIRTPKQER